MELLEKWIYECLGVLMKEPTEETRKIVVKTIASEIEDEEKQLTKAKEIIRELSKSLFVAKGLIRDLCDDTVDFRESKERALYCYNQEHLDGYKKAEAFLKESE